MVIVTIIIIIIIMIIMIIFHSPFPSALLFNPASSLHHHLHKTVRERVERVERERERERKREQERETVRLFSLFLWIFTLFSVGVRV